MDALPEPLPDGLPLPQEEAPPLLALEDIPADDAAVVAAGPPKRQRVGPHVAGQIAAWVAGEFTPDNPVLDGTKCLARVWASGVGGQCRKRPLPNSEVCKAHQRDQAHGKVNGPVPLPKLREFRKAAANAEAAAAAAAAAVEPVGVDFF